MQRIYNILREILGESKQGEYSPNESQYQWNCKTCEEEKGFNSNSYNFETNLVAGVCHCWRCGYKGPISRVIKEFGGPDLLREYYAVIADIKENKYYNLDLFKDNGDFFEDRYIRLPKTYEKIFLETCKDKELKEYLEKRGISQDIIDFYGIGMTTWNEEDWTWRNRIIFPSYDAAGDLNYFVGRAYRSKDQRIKYKNCDADKNKIIYHEDKIQWDNDIYLVEGVIDGIYYPNTISLLGKTLTRKMELYSKLKEKANANIIICLDGDTTIAEVKRIYTTLNRGRLFGKIKYIRLGEGLNGRYVPYVEPEIDGEKFEIHLPFEERKDLSVVDGKNAEYIICDGKKYRYEGYKDFGEIYEALGREGIISTMKTAKQFTEIELSVY